MKQRFSFLWVSLFAIGFLATNLFSQPSWKTLGSLSDPRMLFCATYMGNSEVLVAGGFTTTGAQGSGYVCTNSCEIIDVKNRKISPTMSMTYPRVEFAMLLTKDSNVVAISGAMSDAFAQGGQNRNTPTVEMFNRTTKQWRVIGNLLVARRQHAAVFINEDEILVFGGRLDNIATTDSAEIFNIKTGQSRYAANYPVSRCEILAGLTSDNRIVACTGREGGANSKRESTVFQYNPTINKWGTNGTIYSGVRVASMLKLWDNRLIVSGGVKSESPYVCEKAVWVDSSGTFVSLATMQNERLGHSMAQIDPDNVVTAGRWNSDWTTANTTSEIINISTKQTKSIGSMSVPRAQFAMVSVPQTFDNNGNPLSAAAIAISGSSGRIVDGVGNSTGYMMTPLVEILEECTIPAPLQTLGSTTLCEGESTALTLPQCYPSIKWSTGAATSIIVVRDAGTYSVDIIDANGCKGRAQVTINKVPNAFVIQNIKHDTAHAQNDMLQHTITLTIQNTSNQPVVITAGDIRLISKTVQAMALSGLPINIPASETKTMNITYTTPANGGINDSLMIYNSLRCPLRLAIPDKGIVWVGDDGKEEIPSPQDGVDISIVPNPVTNECSLTLHDSDQEVRIAVFTLDGTQVSDIPAMLVQGKASFSAQQLAVGTYIVLVKAKNMIGKAVFTVLR